MVHENYEGLYFFISINSAYNLKRREDDKVVETSIKNVLHSTSFTTSVFVSISS